METEKWKSIKGFEEFYEVSNFGNIRSVDRIITRSDGIKQPKKGQIMNLRENEDGYLVVHLSKDGFNKYYFVHRLVAESFIENKQNLEEVNHIDFNRKNNNAKNLEWVSHKNNVLYSIKAKRHYCTKDLTGENNPNYGNHILHERYANNKELSREKLGRKGSVNGRAKPVEFTNANGQTYKFSYIGECAKFLIENNYTSSDVNSIRDRIRLSIKNNKTYLKLKFRYVEQI